jgi:hypothetical protein
VLRQHAATGPVPSQVTQADIDRWYAVPAQPARTATWRTLARDAPPSVPTTAMRHAQAAGADYTAYAALRSGQAPNRLTATRASGRRAKIIP